jgi:hypothetical protein
MTDKSKASLVLGLTILSLLPGATSAQPSMDPKVACESRSPNNTYDQKKGTCIKHIGKNPARVACESKGHRWNYATGRCIKLLIKKKLPPAEAPEQVQPDTNTSAGGGGS